MANRSYLYSIDFDRTVEDRTENKKVCGLSEWNYDIPLVFQILVSQNAKLSPSIIWELDEPIAIIADFYKGREKLFIFFEELLKMNLADKNELEVQIIDAKRFLNDKKHENKYIILECGEIYEMGEGELEEQNRKLYENEILNIDERIKEFMDRLRKNKNNTEELQTLGLNFWSEVLYFS